MGPAPVRVCARTAFSSNRRCPSPSPTVGRPGTSRLHSSDYRGLSETSRDKPGPTWADPGEFLSCSQTRRNKEEEQGERSPPTPPPHLNVALLLELKTNPLPLIKEARPHPPKHSWGRSSTPAVPHHTLLPLCRCGADGGAESGAVAGEASQGRAIGTMAIVSL